MFSSTCESSLASPERMDWPVGEEETALMGGRLIPATCGNGHDGEMAIRVRASCLQPRGQGGAREGEVVL